jgi:hypothetical protein
MGVYPALRILKDAAELSARLLFCYYYLKTGVCKAASLSEGAYF